MDQRPKVEDVERLSLLLSGQPLTRHEFLVSGLKAGAGAAGLTALLAACGSSTTTSADKSGRGGQLILQTYGGDDDDARKETIYPKFEKAFGTKLINVRTGIDYGKVKAMVDSGHIQYDMTQNAASIYYTLGPKYFEKIDYSRNPGAWTNVINQNPYAAPQSVSAEPLIYRTDAFPNGKGPQSWADFWDTKKFPGKRALGADGGTPWFTLECALMAAGVPPANVYPIDFKAALDSLSRLRATGDLLIWSSAANATQMLVTSQVVMARNVIAPLSDPISSGQMAITWHNAIAWTEADEIIHGTGSFEQAMNYVEFVVRPEIQAAFAIRNKMGPVNTSALALIPSNIVPYLPVPTQERAYLYEDQQWYGSHYDQLVSEWNQWVRS